MVRPGAKVIIQNGHTMQNSTQQRFSLPAAIQMPSNSKPALASGVKRIRVNCCSIFHAMKHIFPESLPPVQQLVGKMILSVFLFWMGSFLPATAQITLDAVSTGTTTGTSVTVSHTTGTGANRLMLVGISYRNKDSETVSAISYGGSALTLVGTIANGTNSRIYIYRLLNPAQGTANLAVTFNNAVDRGAVVAVATFFNVNQSSPLGTFASATGSSTAPSVDVTAATGQLVFDVLAVRNTTALTPGAGQSERWDLSQTDIRGGGSTEAGAASTTMNWTSGDGAWAIGGVAIRPSPVLSATITNVLCRGAATGAIDLTVTGGVSPYTYAWSNGASTQDLSGIPAGNYVVTVTDAQGATATRINTVSQPATSLTLTHSQTNVTTPGGSNGTIDLTVTGGTPGYTYDWSNDGAENPDNDPQDLSGLTAGTYTVTVTDANGCTATRAVEITEVVNQTTVNKQLYLNDPLGLDRSNPANPVDNTTATTTTLSSGAAGIVVDAISTTSTTTLSSVTLSHTTGTGSNRLMLVGISQKNKLVSSVTYGGTPLTLVGESITSGNARMHIYRLINPPSGTANVVVNFSAVPDKGAVIGVMTFTGVDQTTPLGTFVSATAKNTTPSVTVTSAAGELVFDVVTIRNTSGTVGAGQTQRWNVDSGDEIQVGAASTEPGAASVTMSWTAGGSQDWAIGAVPIKPAAVVNTVSFTQNPVMCGNLIIKSGQAITVRNYVNIISGSMPANPNVTAVLKYGATTIATLTNPAYSGGLLTWTGTLGADVTVPAGQAIVLEITTAQAGVSFQIRYDSQTYPSLVELPVSTFINVNSVEVYSASFPNGSPITDVPNAGTSYIRVSVDDPFGTTDITSVNLTLTKPDNSTVNATLGPANVVSTSGCTKIYQYAWANPTSLGDWDILAIANEGTEGTVTHSLTETVTVVTPTGPVPQNKQLYLSDPSQALDRIDPVATADGTTAQTSILTTGGTETIQTLNTSSATSTGSSVTISNYSPGSGSNRLMMVGVSWSPNDNETISSVTYGGQSLTLVPSSNHQNSNVAQVSMYYLKESGIAAVSPPANIVVTFNEAVQEGVVAGVTTFSGIDQTTTFGTANGATGTSTTPSVTITSASGELVFGVKDNRDNVTTTPVSGETILWDGLGGTRADGVGFSEAGAASVTSSFTLSASKAWAITAVSMKPATTAPNTTTTFTQNPTLCSDLTIKLGETINVSTYVTVTSGSMPGSPSITATLRYGATNIATLSAPTYSGGILTWTTTLGSDVTIPAGQAISLDITTAQSGVAFRIDYDSQTKPSKITLPVTTYIDMTALAMYDAAYPGGSISSTATNGSTVYLRSTVTDPFGADDITGLDISILAPGGGTTNVTGTQVATAGCTKTYEYTWNSPAIPGDYDFTVTAKEGFENTVVDIDYLGFALCPLTVSGTVSIQPTCYVPDGGEITLTVTGGDAPYTWNWSDGSNTGNGTGTTITGLTAGTYNITVTSEGGCTGTASVTINSPTGPALSTAPSNASCLGNDGSIVLTVTGGSGNFTFFWDDGTSTQSRFGLSSGTYTVTVTDEDNGCTSTTSARSWRPRPKPCSTTTPSTGPPCPRG